MKLVDEFRDAAAVRSLVAAIESTVTRPWTLMEICGGQTHAILKFGLDQLLPAGVRLVHGPGCPVCVTPIEMIDRALVIAARPEATVCTFGDMLRVPGSREDLLSVKARGGDVRVVYSPLDAVELARARPEREVVLFAVGFETTAPATALAIKTAAAGGVGNFSALVSHVLVPPAMHAILAAPDVQIDAFLAAGHVCTVMGTEGYVALARRHGAPIVVTGFEPVDLLAGVLRAIRQLEAGEARVENAYARVVQAGGNPLARALLDEVFEPVDRAWRGVGVLPRSGLALRGAYRGFAAEERFPIAELRAREHPECIAGHVLRGAKRPTDCPLFGGECTPTRPRGAPMVSSEGACAAYYRYRRRADGEGA